MTGVANWRRIEQQLFGQLPFIHVPRRWPEFRPDESVQLVLGQRVPELRLQRLEDGRCLEWPRHLLRLPHPLNNRNFALTFSFFFPCFRFASSHSSSPPNNNINNISNNINNRLCPLLPWWGLSLSTERRRRRRRGCGRTGNCSAVGGCDSCPWRHPASPPTAATKHK